MAIAGSSIVAIKLLKLAVISAGLAWVILRALMVKIPPPEGRRVTAAEAPGLFEAIERAS